ncbi:hypothetical protein [Streptomyces sp. NPDC048436]|uniref:hypothetical protein n=1 Tax=Streptomyces sp. NPDC048436 TaxID=3365550 RepID=UPI00371F8208
MRRNRDRPGWPSPRTGQLTETGCLLPSSATGYSFSAELTGRWEETPSARPHHDPRAAATHHALTAARTVARLYPLTESQAAQAHINTRLGVGADLQDAAVRLLWAKVQLTVTDQDHAAAAALQRRMHDQAMNDQAHRQQQQRVEELHQALSATPTLALAYWLTHHPESSDRDTINALEQLVRKIASYAPDNAWVNVAHLLQTFVEQLNEAQRVNLVEALAQIVTRYDQPNLAGQLRTIATKLSAANGHAPSGPPPEHQALRPPVV